MLAFTCVRRFRCRCFDCRLFGTAIGNLFARGRGLVEPDLLQAAPGAFVHGRNTATRLTIQIHAASRTEPATGLGAEYILRDPQKDLLPDRRTEIQPVAALRQRMYFSPEFGFGDLFRGQSLEKYIHVVARVHGQGCQTPSARRLETAADLASHQNAVADRACVDVNTEGPGERDLGILPERGVGRDLAMNPDRPPRHFSEVENQHKRKK